MRPESLSTFMGVTDCHSADGNLIFPVFLTVQRSALCSSYSSCYTGMTVQGGVLQQSPLLVILTQLSLKIPSKVHSEVMSADMKPRQTGCCVTAIDSFLILSRNIWQQVLKLQPSDLLCILCKYCSKCTVHQRAV